MKIRDEDKKAIQDLVDSETAKYLKNIPNEVRTILQSALLSMLGLRTESWGGKITYTVDSFRNNKDAAMMQIINSIATEEMEKFLPDLVRATIAQMVADKKMMNALAKEAKAVFSRSIESSLRSRAEAFAKEQAELAVKNMQGLDLGSIIPTNIDPADPDSFGGEVGAYILEEYARAQAEGRQISVRRVERDGQTVVIFENAPNLRP
jgi:hypothetical protein